MMSLEAVLDIKRYRVVAISKDETVAAAMDKMVRDKTSALLVIAGHKPWGIFTKRDLLACLYHKPEKLLQAIKIEEVITGELMTAAVSDPIDTTATMMVKAGISHLPVAKETDVVAVITLSDLLVFQNKTLIAELGDLESYINDLQTAELD